MGAFMEILDTTIVNVSLPHISGNLAVSYDDATWALTSYLLANGIVLTISGWLSSVFGRKRYFLICIAGFTVCSFLCGIASSLPELVVFRLMQGFFGGGLQPNQQSIILDTFEPAQRGKAFGITAIATIVAPVLGPTLGGFLTDNYGWRWVFLINVPVGTLTFFAVQALVEDPPWARARSAGVDYIGLALITLGLGCLEVVMDRGEELDWFGSPFIVTMLILAVLGICGAIAWLLYAEKPVVESAGAERPQLRAGLPHDRGDGERAVRERGGDPAVRAAAARLHGDLGRADPVAGRAGGDHADPHRGSADEGGARSNT